MDTEHRVIAELLALKDAPDDGLLDQEVAISDHRRRQHPVRRRDRTGASFHPEHVKGSV